MGAVTGEGGDVVVGAVITLRSDQTVFVATSNAEGRFEFSGLRFGAYSLAARKAGYVRLDEESHSIDISASNVRHYIPLKLRKSAVVAGQVVLSDGRPALGAEVVASCYTSESSVNRTAAATTDDHGEFRLFGIVPSKCYVEARAQWQGGSRGLSVLKPPVPELTSRYPPGERSIRNTINLNPGEVANVGNLVVDIQDSAQVRPHSARAGFIDGQVLEVRSNAVVFPAVVSAENEKSGVVRTAATDFMGRYVLELSPGTYRVSASAPGYVTDLSKSRSVRVSEGDRPGEPTRFITFQLRRAGNIEGSVYLENGEPLQDAIIHLYRDKYVLGQKRLIVETPTVFTDDRGTFRLFGLQPGSYFVSASFGESQGSRSRAGSASGEKDEMSPVFYPAGSASMAAPINIDAESSISGITLTWFPRNHGTLSARVFSDRGDVAPNVAVTVGPTLRSRLPLKPGVRAKTDVNGEVRFVGLASGEYYIHAQGTSQEGEAEFGVGFAQVADDEPAPVHVTLMRGVEVQGRLELSDRVPATNASSFLVRAFPTSFDDVPVAASVPMAQPHVSGEFVLPNLWGSALIRVDRSGDVEKSGNYVLQRVLVDGVDMTDTPMRFDPKSGPRVITVEVGPSRTELSGTVRVANGDPAARCTVIAFETDPKKLGPWSRFVATIPCEADSSFRYYRLPAGQYFLVAVSSIDTGVQYDNEWLDAHKTQAKIVQLTDGIPQSLALKLAKD